MRRFIALALAVSLVASCDPMAVALRKVLVAGGGSSVVIPVRYPPGDDSWVRSASNPILTATEAWEGSAVVEAVVTREASTWKMWYRGGWATTAVGYATSSDGISWTKYAGNPVYGQGGSSMAGNDGGQPWVLLVGSTYYLYATNNTDAPFHVNVATSSDGIAWTTQSSTVTLPAGCTLWGNRVVWKEGSDWKMLQEAFVSAISRWAIYLYTSSDGLTWSIGNGGSALSTLQVFAGGTYGGPRFARNDVGTITPQWDGLYQLWYHATPGAGALPTNIYHATSPDLITWTQTSPNPVLTYAGSGFEVDQVAGPVPIVVSGLGYLFYDGDDNTGEDAAIGVATSLAVLP